MTSKKTRQKARAKKLAAARRTKSKAPDGVIVARAPKDSIKPLMQLLFDIAVTAENAIYSVALPCDARERRLFWFDAGILGRGSNALKSVRILCELTHWESASASVRQLFELVVNAEHLDSLEDRYEGIFQYAKFGLMQRIEHERLSILYEQKIGRPADTDRLDMLNHMLEESFPEYRFVKDDGRLSKKKTWSGHTTKYLAQKSQNSLREDQYELLFSAWSEQAHATPGTLLHDIMPRSFDAERMVKDDIVQVAETATMAVLLFLELWALLPRVPEVDSDKRLQWTTAALGMAFKYGGHAPIA
jgi:hypothetical protein